MAKLTKRTVDGLKAQAKEVVAWDDELSGFGVRVKPSGVKSYLIQYRNASGRSRRYTFGRHGTITPDEARKQAKQLLAAAAKGEDPAEAKAQGLHAPTMADLADRYLLEHARPKKKPKSLAGDKHLLRTYILPRLGWLRVEAVNRADVARLHHSMRKTPYSANRCLALVSKMLNLAESWGLRPLNSNPCRHIQKFREEKRERFLSAEELARLGKVLAEAEADGSEMSSVITALRLLIFTGCRSGEILSLRWQDVDLEARCLRLPDSKTGRKLVPLGQAAIEVLMAAPRQAGSPWVCPGVSPLKPLVGLPRAWKRIKQRANLTNLRIHDLRHSFASIGAAAGMGLPTIGALLGHTQAATTQRYAHLAHDPLRQAADEINQRIAAAMAGPVNEKVVNLDQRRDEK